MSWARLAAKNSGKIEFPVLRWDIFQNALGWAVAVARAVPGAVGARDGVLIALGHYLTREQAEAPLDRYWPGAEHDPEAPPFPELRRQLHEYLAHERQEFDIPLEVDGTDFQRLCWDALRRIPYGETRSYSQLARDIGRPAAVRAVGLANHDNPIGVIIPCHRVIGANGSLTGYAGGLDMKRTLLELEGVLPRTLDLAP